MSQAEPKTRLRTLAEKKPLAHPGLFALHTREYDYPPPEHLREIYGQVWRGVSPEHEMAPKKLAHIKPREHGKSEAGTVDNAAWMACHDPASRTLIMSEGSDLAEDKLGQVSNIIDKHGHKFGVEIKTDNNAALELYNDANHGEATVEAAGFGSRVTGGHFDLIIFDDLVDWPSQRTEARRDKIWTQFQNYLNLGSEGETVFLVLGTRKHPEDLYHHLIENPAWYTIVDRAIDDWSVVENREYDLITQNPETGETHRYPAENVGEIPPDEVIVDADPHREVEVLWPERWPLNKLLVDMHAGYGTDKGNLVWKRENQNDAKALQGQILSEDMLTFVDPDDIPTDLQISFGLDPAVEDDPERAATSDTDFWGLAKLGHAQDRTYVLKVWRKRGLSLSQGLTWVASRVGDYRGQVIVEDNHAQRWFVQEAKDRGLVVRGDSSSASKEERIIQMAARFESGRIVVSEGLNDLQSFVNEWAAFPTGDHDDRLDAIAKAYRGVGGQTVSIGQHDMSDLPT